MTGGLVLAYTTGALNVTADFCGVLYDWRGRFTSFMGYHMFIKLYWLGFYYAFVTNNLLAGSIIGPNSLATTRSKEMHQQLRQIFGVALTDTEMRRMLPGVQETVKSHMQCWSESGGVKCFDASLEVVFDVIVNKVMQFDWSPPVIMLTY